MTKVIDEPYTKKKCIEHQDLMVAQMHHPSRRRTTV